MHPIQTKIYIESRHKKTGNLTRETGVEIPYNKIDEGMKKLWNNPNDLYEPIFDRGWMDLDDGAQNVLIRNDDNELEYVGANEYELFNPKFTRRNQELDASRHMARKLIVIVSSIPFWCCCLAYLIDDILSHPKF